jgi:hypothetical protein
MLKEVAAMRRKQVVIIAILSALLIPLWAQSPPDSVVIYANSFEAPEDTSGWIGLVSEMFVEDPAPSAGSRSLLIGGGCPMPTACIDLPCTTGAATFRLSFWGKAGAVTPYGGTIGVGPLDSYREGIEIYADSLDWHYYQMEEDLLLSGLDTLRIWIFAGGIVYDDVQIDGLEVVAWPLLAAENAGMQPEVFMLHPAYPNPFNPVTTIRYTLPADEYMTLRIYDLMGHEVATLEEGRQPAGDYKLLFDAGSLPSGVYVARLLTSEEARSIKLLLLK